jgi:hypothetical protein
MTHPRTIGELRSEAIDWRRQIRVPVTDELHEAVRSAAARLDTSIAEIMRVALIDWMEANADAIFDQKPPGT